MNYTLPRRYRKWSDGEPVDPNFPFRLVYRTSLVEAMWRRDPWGMLELVATRQNKNAA